MSEHYDIVVVGAGISGATIAERYASDGKRVLVIEKRDHIAGNCHDYEADGLRVSTYGVHIFHTDYEDVWAYINRFSEWTPFQHKVKAKVGDKLVPVPVNIETINTLFDLSLDEKTVGEWFKQNTVANPNPKNSKEACIARVGERLYELLFKPYTKKQWNKLPDDLDPSVLNRIPVRASFEDRYFSGKYEALPKHGYTEFVRKMLDSTNITVKLNTDFFELKDSITYDKLFYTGPIDAFYASLGLPRLEYRSLEFVSENHEMEYYQPHLVVNYPSSDVPFTRIIEYKHIQSGPPSNRTVIVKEIPSDKGEPYYPVVSQKNKELYEQYRQHAEKEKDIYFVGRLASYKYYNMDQAIKASLDLYSSLTC